MTPASRTILFWFSAVLSASALLYLLFPAIDERAFEDAALGTETQTVIGTLSGDRIHCFSMVDGAECLEPALARGLPRQVLWLGNSQLHAVNPLRDGDTLASVQLTRALRALDTELLTFSQPNANLQEHLILFETLAGRLELDLLLLPVVFDDTREAGIRQDIRENMSDQDVVARLSRSEIGRELLSRLLSDNVLCAE